MQASKSSCLAAAAAASVATVSPALPSLPSSSTTPRRVSTHATHATRTHAEKDDASLSDGSRPHCADAKPDAPIEHLDIATLFPGSQLSHVLHVVSEPNVAAVSNVIECLDAPQSGALDIQ